MAEIDRTMRLQPARPGHRRVRTLSAAVRVFVLQTLTAPPSSGKRHAVRDRLDRRGRYPEGCIQARRSGSRPHPERSRTIVIAAALRILLAQSPFPLGARRKLLARVRPPLWQRGAMGRNSEGPLGKAIEPMART